MKPKVILYTAMSLDGRTTGFSVDMGLFYSLAQQWGENAAESSRFHSTLWTKN
jgi:hypothetical protein